MGRKSDLERHIRGSYDLIRQYEEIEQLSDRPKEIARARRNIDEQLTLVQGYLDEYLALCRRVGLPPTPDVEEIAARFRDDGPAPPPERADPGWNTAAIRDLLLGALSDEELNALCFDHFPPVYESFSAGMSKGQKVQILLAYCVRREEVDRLLERVKERNPGRYEAFDREFTRIDPNSP